MASNSNVIKVDFEYTSTVVAKLVIKKIDFPILSLVESIYNTSPRDLPLLHATFTKIPLSCTLIQDSHTDIANDISLRDEVKLGE